MNALNVLCAQLTRDVFAMAKFFIIIIIIIIIIISIKQILFKVSLSSL